MLVIPALAELAVGGYKIGVPSLWRDEGYTLDSSQRSVSEILAMLGHQDAVHGLYYILMHFSITLLGSSATALRLPSLLAMSLAAAATAALGRRLAVVTALPAPGLTGLAAGLLLVAVPLTTWYAQDARPYGLISLFAVVSSYALVRGTAEGRTRWWVLYTAALVLAGLFDLFALLIVAAHGVSMGIAWLRARAAAQREPGLLRGPLARWLVATSAAVVLLAPLIYLAFRQAATLGWARPPDSSTVLGLVADLAGSRPLIPLVAVLVLAGAMVDIGSRRRREARRGEETGAGIGGERTGGRKAGGAAARGRTGGGLGGEGLTLAVVALPWLLLPPVLLLSESELHPLYTERYVLFCFPALALLSAAGLGWIAGQVRRTPFGRRSRVRAALPSAALAVALAAMLVGPQLGIRLTSRRTDDLRTVSAIVAAHEEPGDAIFYQPWTTRVIGLAYPAPFLRLRDVTLAESGVRSATLLGEEVSAPVLAQRFAGVRRVWTVRWHTSLTPLSSDHLTGEETALVKHMRLVRRWRVMSVLLSLYAVGSPGRSAP